MGQARGLIDMSVETKGAPGTRRGRPAPAGVTRRRSGLERQNRLSALAFISPWLVGFAVFTAWPMIYSLYLSFTDYDNYNAPNWVGLANYEQMFQDPKVLTALSNTAFYTVIQVPLYVLVALALAVLLNKATKGVGFFRTAFYLPKMTPQVAIGVLFLLLFNGQNGLVNKFLAVFGIEGPAWTTDPAWQKPGLIIISLWTVGSSVVILLAALKNVPKELYESARVDGASPWRQFRSITLPMISSQIFFVFIVNTIAAFQLFAEAYTAFYGSTSGGSYTTDAVLFYVIYLFQQAFAEFHMGYASALAWLLFLVILVVTVIQMTVSKRFVYYEGE
ncbi:carbohydrate ABC transporter permease [Oerskovia jenensis]|uniref:carbohydrate ABC transporter permease n=1 Tax=Oerskovia jenensis TaxID=162169 RepID=UPI0036DEADA2